MTRTFFRYLVILVIGVALAAALIRIQRNARRLQGENRELAGANEAAAQKLALTESTLESLRLDLSNAVVLLHEATNASSRLAAQHDDSQSLQNEKLRGEIARLSGENVRLETQLNALGAQVQDLQATKRQTDSALRELQGALAASSNEVVRLRGADAEKTARLATRDQELANMRSERDAAKKSVQELAAARETADRALQALQAKSGADQAELATLRARLAEQKAGPASGAPAPK